VHPNALEDRLVEKEEGDPVVGPLIPTHRLAWAAGKHKNVLIVPPRKGTMLIDAGSINVIPPILHGGQA